MSIEMWQNPNDPKPIKTRYPIGYEGLEHSSTGILGFAADIFRASYPWLPISAALSTMLVDGLNWKSGIPTHGRWAGPGWSAGTRGSEITWGTLPCYNNKIKEIQNNPNLDPNSCISLVDAICKAHDWRYDQAEKQYGEGTVDYVNAIKNADIVMLQDIAVACTTHSYQEIVGTWDKNTYTNTFDNTEITYLTKLVPAFVKKIELFDNANAADKSLAYTALNIINSVIPLDGTVLQDPSDPSNKTIFHLTNGIMITQKESASSSDAWIVDLNASGNAKPVNVNIAYGIGSTKAPDTFVSEGSGVIRINGGSGNDKITIVRAKNDITSNFKFEIVGSSGNDAYYLDRSFNYKLIDSGENSIFIDDGNGGWIDVGNLYKKVADGSWESADGDEQLTQGATWTLTFEDGSTVQLGNGFQSGDFGINLMTIPDNPTATNTIIDTDAGYPGKGAFPICDTAQNDRIEGRGGDDWIGNFGGSGGNDWLQGNAGNDLIQTNITGYNVAEGNAGSDYITGGMHDDKLFGDDYGEMDQLIAAGETAQSINERGDLIAGREGNDFVYGSNRNDALLGGFGKDLLVGGGGDDVIYGDDNFGVAGGGTGDAFWDGWSFTVSGNTVSFSNVDFQKATTGDDDVIYAGTGNDHVEAGYGDDEVYGGDGLDTIFGEAGNDFIEGGNGDDILLGDSNTIDVTLHGNDYIDGGDGNDLIYGQGGTGNDQYQFGRGDGIVSIDNCADDYALATDTVAFGADISQDDLEFVREANDLRINIKGTTDSLIIWDWFTSETGKVDQFAFTDSSVMTAAEIDALGVSSFYGTAGDDSMTGSATNDKLYGMAGNDSLQGNAGNDLLDGGAGNDQLNGSTGNDTYVFGRGYGQDVVIDQDSTGGNIDTILLNSDVSTSDIRFARVIVRVSSDVVLDNLEISIAGTSDKLTLQTWFDASGVWSIERIQFADNTIWDTAAIRRQMLIGTEGNDNLQGLDTADAISGNGGDDTIYGGADDDTISGGPGNDYLQGDTANDTYVFNRGDGVDTISNYAEDGAASTDTVVFGTGITLADLDFIKQGNTLQINIRNTADTLIIKDEIGTGDNFHVDQFRFTADGSVMMAAQIDANGFIINGTSGADRIYGYEGNDTLCGYDGNDTLCGGAGNDYLEGDYGDDVYVFERGSGNDRIDNHSADYNTTTDTVMFGSGITPDDLDVTKVGNDFLIHINGTEDTLTINSYFYSGWYKVDQYKFPDNTTLTVNQLEAKLSCTLFGGDGDDTISGTYGNDTIYGYSGNDSVNASYGDDVIYGGDGDDTLAGGDGNDILNGQAGCDSLTGGNGSDTLDGGPGNDTLNGGSNSDYSDYDTYIFSLGSGTDTIINPYGHQNDIVAFGAGITLSDLILTRVGDDLQINISGTSDTLIIKQWFYMTYYHKQVGLFKFADGTTLTANEMDANKVLGTTGNDNLTGTSGNDYMLGYAGNDTLAGGVGADTLNGSSGADSLIGGAGDDVYFVDDAGDIIIESAGEGTDTIKSSITYTLGNNIENLTLSGTSAINGTGNVLDNIITGNTAANILDGGAGADTLNGGLGNDTLSGGGGNDSMSGGAGDDTYLFGRDFGQDKISEWDSTAGNIDTILLDSSVSPGDISLKRTNSYDLRLSIQGATDTLTVSSWYLENNYGVVERIVFNDGTIWDAGMIRDMSLPQPSDGDNELYGGSSGDIIHGLGGSDVIYGLDGNDTLYGDADNDTLDGGSGTDVLIGGTGDDYYMVDSLDDVVTENTGEGTDTIMAVYGNYVLGANVENLILQSGTNGVGNELDNWITGNDYSNALTGNAGNDTLDGGAGSDTMLGGVGNDTYIVDNTSDVATENAGEGTDTVQSSITYTLGNNLENLTLTGTNAINGTGNTLANYLTGNSLVNILTGGAGNDTLDGGGGADSLVGGADNDTYIINNTGVTITESSGAGIDTVLSSVTYTLAANVENLTLTGTNAINGTGNTLANVLTGNSANNTLSGGTGADTMIGGNGDDTYIRDNTGDVITENANEGIDTVQTNLAYTLGANLENLTLTGTSAISGTGNSLANYLTGNTAANTLTGGVGDDTLNGGTGADTMIGGADNDTYIRDNTGDVITENASAGIDTVQTNLAYTLAANVENLTLTGTSAINGTGNTMDNYLTGNSAINTLTGAAGNDTLDGGLGNDSLAGGAGNDTYIFRVGSGQDSVDNNDTTTGRIDTIRFEDVTSSGLRGVRQSGNDLILDYGVSDTVTIKSSYLGTGYQVDRFTFADNVTYTTSQLLAAHASGIKMMSASAGITQEQTNPNTVTSGRTIVASKASTTITQEHENLASPSNDPGGSEGNHRSLIGTTVFDPDVSSAYTSYGEIVSPKAYAVITQEKTAFAIDPGSRGSLMADIEGIMSKDQLTGLFSNLNYGNDGTERLSVSDGYFISRQDIENIVTTMSEINNTGMDVMQKYNAMMSDQTNISTLAQTWHQM